MHNEISLKSVYDGLKGTQVHLFIVIADNKSSDNKQMLSKSVLCPRFRMQRFKLQMSKGMLERLWRNVRLRAEWESQIGKSKCNEEPRRWLWKCLFSSA